MFFNFLSQDSMYLTIKYLCALKKRCNDNIDVQYLSEYWANLLKFTGLNYSFAFSTNSKSCYKIYFSSCSLSNKMSFVHKYIVCILTRRMTISLVVMRQVRLSTDLRVIIASGSNGRGTGFRFQIHFELERSHLQSRRFVFMLERNDSVQHFNITCVKMFFFLYI